MQCSTSAASGWISRKKNSLGLLHCARCDLEKVQAGSVVARCLFCLFGWLGLALKKHLIKTNLELLQTTIIVMMLQRPIMSQTILSFSRIVLTKKDRQEAEGYSRHRVWHHQAERHKIHSLGFLGPLARAASEREDTILTPNNCCVCVRVHSAESQNDDANVKWVQRFFSFVEPTIRICQKMRWFVIESIPTNCFCGVFGL